MNDSKWVLMELSDSTMWIIDFLLHEASTEKESKKKRSEDEEERNKRRKKIATIFYIFITQSPWYKLIQSILLLSDTILPIISVFSFSQFLTFSFFPFFFSQTNCDIASQEYSMKMDFSNSMQYINNNM